MKELVQKKIFFVTYPGIMKIVEPGAAKVNILPPRSLPLDQAYQVWRSRPVSNYIGVFSTALVLGINYTKYYIDQFRHTHSLGD